jgi:hypothetical protein
MKTLWEILQSKIKGPLELQLNNPLKLKLGTAVHINEIDFRDYTFYVKRIFDYERTINSEIFNFTDYDLLARPLGGEDVKIRLRLNPMANPDEVAGLTHNVLLLKLYDEIAYDEGLHNVVRDDTGKFEVLMDGTCTERFFRINDVLEPYKAKVTIVSDDKPEEFQNISLDYWDYWRDTVNEANQSLVEYLFVEMDDSNGWFQLWKGFDINAEAVVIL